MREKGNSLLETKRKNRVLIKNEIFFTKNATRTQIAKNLSLTKPTITTSVNEMIQEGMVQEAPIDENQLSNVMGRHPMVLSFRPEYAYAVGVEIGPYSTEAVLLDLTGHVIKQCSGIQASTYYNEMLAEVKELIKVVLPEDKEKVLAIGIGTPGFVDTVHGVIRNSPRAKWDDAPIASDLSETFGLPVIVDNNVRARCIGYDMLKRGIHSDLMAYFYISKGLACPIMFGNESVTGYTSGAGEVGHMVIGITGEDDIEVRIADEIASEQGVMEKAQQLLFDDRFPELRSHLAIYGRFTIGDIVKMQADGVAAADKIITGTVKNAGIVLANVVNMLNPGLVVVDAQLMKNEKNREELIRTASEHFYGLKEQEVQIRFVETTKLAGARGAACNVIKKCFLDL